MPSRACRPAPCIAEGMLTVRAIASVSLSSPESGRVSSEDTRLPRQSYAFFIGILVVMTILIWIVFKPFVIFMVTGVFVAVLALPIDKFWEKRLPNRIAAGMTMLTLTLMLTIPILGLGFSLANDAQALAGAIQDGEHDVWIQDGLNNTLVQEGLEFAFPTNTTDERNETVLGYADGLEGQALAQLTALGKRMAQALPGFIIATMVILFVVYYVLTDGERLVGYLKRAAPIPSKQVDFLLAEAENGMRAVFVGQILTSTIQGALGGVGFLIAGVPGAVVWAAVMAVLSLLPVVGAFLVWIPAVAFLFFQWSNGDAALWQPIFLLAWSAIIVSQVDNFIRPKLIGDRANIHPIFVLVGVLGGVAAFGFIGLFLGPLIVGITISVLKVWETDYLDPLVGRQDPTAIRVPVRGKAVADFESQMQRKVPANIAPAGTAPDQTPAADDAPGNETGSPDDVEPPRP